MFSFLKLNDLFKTTKNKVFHIFNNKVSFLAQSFPYFSFHIIKPNKLK